MRDRVISPQGVVENPLEGIQDAMTEPEYRSAPGLNHSSLKHMRVNAEEFKYRLNLWEPPSPVMAFGQYADWLICNHDKSVELHSQFVLQPEEYSGNAKVWKEWKEQQLAARKTIITPDMHTRANGLLEAIQRKAIWGMIKESRTQVPVFAVINQGGLHIQAKALLDMLPNGYVGIWDFKTGSDCSAEYWRKHVIDMSLQSQAAWYGKLCSLAGMRDMDRFFHIVLETQPPYHSQTHELSRPFIQHGNMLIEKWLSQYITCEQTGQWDGYQQGVNLLTPPPWLEKELRAAW